MTAEVAIINRASIAVAADSAVTIGKDRVWKNANKLFHMSSNTDIGVMFFGNGDFLGVPWEVILKQFRKHVGERQFDTIKQCSDEFCDFINDVEIPAGEEGNLSIYMCILAVVGEAQRRLTEKARVERRKQFVTVLSDLMSDVEAGQEILPDLTREKFAKKFSAQIKSLAADVLDGDFSVTKPIHTKLIDACLAHVKYDFRSKISTGIVFVGFGEKQLLPSLVELCVDGRTASKARAWTERERDLNSPKEGSAFVIPFAQSDIAYLFVEGLLPQFKTYVERVLMKSLTKKSEMLVDEYVPDADKAVEKARQNTIDKAQTKEFMKQFGKFRDNSVVNPMMDVIQSLPKEEMAAMAEALVDITSLRRKVDSQLETVGGPIDVAVITKSDGFVWIKRKHYFDKNINQDFMYRRSKRYGGGSSGRY